MDLLNQVYRHLSPTPYEHGTTTLLVEPRRYPQPPSTLNAMVDQASLRSNKGKQPAATPIGSKVSSPSKQLYQRPSEIGPLCTHNAMNANTERVAHTQRPRKPYIG